MGRTRDLDSSPMVPLLVHYAIPSIIGKVVSTPYNMVGRIYIEHRYERGRPPHPRSFTFVILLGTILIKEKEVYHYGR